MADDRLWLVCRLCGNGIQICKLGFGYDAYAGTPVISEFVNEHLEKCALPVLRTDDPDNRLGVDKVVKRMLGLFTEEDVEEMGCEFPENIGLRKSTGRGVCRIKPKFKVKLVD